MPNQRFWSDGHRRIADRVADLLVAEDQILLNLRIGQADFLQPVPANQVCTVTTDAVVGEQPCAVLQRRRVVAAITRPGVHRECRLRQQDAEVAAARSIAINATRARMFSWRLMRSMRRERHAFWNGFERSHSAPPRHQRKEREVHQASAPAPTALRAASALAYRDSPESERRPPSRSATRNATRADSASIAPANSQATASRRRSHRHAH